MSLCVFCVFCGSDLRGPLPQGAAVRPEAGTAEHAKHANQGLPPGAHLSAPDVTLRVLRVLRFRFPWSPPARVAVRPEGGTAEHAKHANKAVPPGACVSGPMMPIG